MALQRSSDRRTFKNTFAPHVGNSELDVQAIIVALKTTLIHYDELPKEVREAVDNECRMHPT